MKHNYPTNLEDAILRIKELETICAEQKARIEELENRKIAGRRIHDSGWQANYDLFLPLYENGESIPAIVEKTGISRRTVYRYKAYYDKLMEDKAKQAPHTD